MVDVFPLIWLRSEVGVDCCKVTGGSGLLGGVCEKKQTLQPWFKAEDLREPLVCSLSVTFDVHRFCWNYLPTLFLKNWARSLRFCFALIRYSCQTALLWCEQWACRASWWGRLLYQPDLLLQLRYLAHVYKNVNSFFFFPHLFFLTTVEKILPYF